MSIRMMLAVCAVAISVAVPASAEEGLGFNTQFAGSIISSSGALINGRQSDGCQIHVDLGPSGGLICVYGQCTYTGQTTLTGQMQYQFGGEAAAYSTSQSQPELTVIKCTLVSPAQGLPGERPTLSVDVEVACAGPGCVAAGTVSGWPVRPVVACIDGYAIFGPTPVVTKNIVAACKSSTL